VQAIYQKQLAGHSVSELKRQFREQTAFERVDQDYFLELLADALGNEEALGEVIDSVVDRPRDQLDPVEYAILLIGLFELKHRIDIPYRVVINEGVNLAKRFGAQESHKYINGCLDKAAQNLRAIEIKGGL
jgi:N utilization substance protein B